MIDAHGTPRRTNGTIKREQSEAAKVNTAHPPCLGCQGIVAPRAGENFSKWMRREYCARTCSARNRTQVVEARERSAVMEAEHAPCTICARPVRRRKNETPIKYRERATCGQESCARTHHAAALKARNEAIAEQKAIDREMRKSAEEMAEARSRHEIDYGAGFGAHNIVPPASDSFGKVGGKPLNSSFGVSAGWAVVQ